MEIPSAKPSETWGLKRFSLHRDHPGRVLSWERLIGSIRRECLDHVIVFNEASLRRILTSYFYYYERSRTHLSLAKDAPEERPVQPRELGHVIELSQVGGLHHRYERCAA